MRTSDVDILMVPGWQGSEPEHWQSRWERNLSTAKFVGENDWNVPNRDVWVGNIIRAISETKGSAVVVAHSVGVIAMAHVGQKLPKGVLAGAFLVSPADVDNAQDWPITHGLKWPQDGHGFSPIPLDVLPFPAMVVSSSTDPYCRQDRARHFAASWGAEFIDAGPVGHITAASGHGPWPEGVLRFGKFLASLTPAAPGKGMNGAGAAGS